VPKVNEKWRGIAAGALVIAVLATQVSSARAATAAASSANKVTICHFAGHVGDAVNFKKGGGCEAAGGHEIEVALQACSNGHGINPKLCAKKPGDGEEKEDKADPGVE
jgi:hypothetical protein